MRVDVEEVAREAAESAFVAWLVERWKKEAKAHGDEGGKAAA